MTALYDTCGRRYPYIFDASCQEAIEKIDWCPRQELNLRRPALQAGALPPELREQKVAEGVGFEPTNGNPLPVFKAGAFNHSASPP